MSDNLYKEEDVPKTVNPTQETCKVCMRTEKEDWILPELSTPLHFCKGCLLAVHGPCYGLGSDAGRMIVCDRCLSKGPSGMVECVLCKGVSGAFRQIDTSFYHVTCLLFSPFFEVSDWETMTFSQTSEITYSDNSSEKNCVFCGHTGYLIQCTDCEKQAHPICLLSSWLVLGFWERTDFSCDEHRDAHERYCFCGNGYNEAVDFMIACDACDIWYHGDCVGVSSAISGNLEEYVCKLCSHWASAKTAWLKSQKPLSLPKSLVNFKIFDWILAARDIEKRSTDAFNAPVSLDVMQELAEAANALPFPLRSTPNLTKKLHQAQNIVIAELTAPPEEIDIEQAEKLKSALVQAKDIGVIVPNKKKIKAQLRVFKAVSKLKNAMEKPASYHHAQTLAGDVSQVLSNQHPILTDFKKKIETCTNWFAKAKSAVSKSHAAPLNLKLRWSDFEAILKKAKDLPFLMTNEEATIQAELDAALAWDTRYRESARPLPLGDLPSFLEDAGSCSVRTDLMEEAEADCERLKAWVNKTENYLSPTGETLPTNEEIRGHIEWGTQQIEPVTSIHDYKTALLLKLNDASVWQANAQGALTNRVSAQKVNNLIREAKSLCCSFPELARLEECAVVFTRISDTIHKKHKEEQLFSLLEEARSINADEKFIQTLENKIADAQELRDKVRSSLATITDEPQELYSKALEELKNSRTELTEEREMVEDRLKSLKWLESTQEAFADGKKRQGELETLRAAVKSGFQIAYRDRKADDFVQTLAERLWDLEFAHFSMCDEVTLEQLLELKAKGDYLVREPDTLKTFKNTVSKVERATNFFDNLLSADLSELFASDLPALRQQIEFYRGELENCGIIMSDKYLKVLNWDKWIDWSLSTHEALESASKQSIDVLYEMNQQALSLGVPLAVPENKRLNEQISQYEQWLYKFSAYQSTSRFYVTANIDIQQYLRKAQERPKLSVTELQELLQQAQELSVSCESDIDKMKADLVFFEEWKTRALRILEQYAEHLRRCKEEPQSYWQSEECKEFYQVCEDYCARIPVEDEALAKQICSCEWNLRGQRILRQSEKIPAQEWSDLFASIELLDKQFLDKFTLDRLKLQDALNAQIADDVLKLKTYQEGSEIKAMTFEDLENLSRQMMVCKVELNDVDLVDDTLKYCRELEDKFKTLREHKSFFEEFKELNNAINQLPVSLSEVSGQLKEVITSASSLNVRIKLLKDYAGNNKLDRGKVEQFLLDYKGSLAKIKDAEELKSELEFGKNLLAEATAALESSETTLETLNTIMGKLGSLQINMGTSEQTVKLQIWKRRVELSSNSKVSFPVLVGWYNQGLQKREPSIKEELEKLEKLVKQGESFKSKLAACSSLEAINQVESEIEKLPFDLTHSIIENRTRITLKESKPTAKAPSEPVPAKRPPPEEPTVQLDPVRRDSVKAIMSALAKDPYYKWSKHPNKAKGISRKLEDIAYKNNIGRGYDLAIKNVCKKLRVLQEFEDFSKKLKAAAITPEELSYYDIDSIAKPKALRRIFDCEPKIKVTINRKEYTSIESHPTKRPKISSNPPPVQKQVAKEIPLKPIPKPEPTVKVPPTIKKPTNDFSFNSLLNDIQAFAKKKEQSIYPSKPKKEFIAVSEKYRNQQPKEVKDVKEPKEQMAPDEEQMELSKYRLEKFGFTNESLPAKRTGESTERPRKMRHMQEGRFSSSEEELEGEPKPADPTLSRPIYDDDLFGKTKEEYNLEERAGKIEPRVKPSKSTLYDPLSASAPKNKAPVGSLLKIWSGTLEYGKFAIGVEMFSVDNIEHFQKLPQFPEQVSVHGRVKQSEFEHYVHQNTSTPAARKSMVTAWVQAAPNFDRKFREFAKDLKDKDRAAVLRFSSNLNLYLSPLSEQFKNFLTNTAKINIIQRVDSSVLEHVSDKEKLGCIVFYKKSGERGRLLDPEILARVDPSKAADDFGNEDSAMSSITSDEEDFVKPAAPVEDKAPAESGPNNNEINSLISGIRQQVEQETNKQTNNVQNVSQFLLQQLPPGYNYMYGAQPIYPNYYMNNPQYYHRPASPQKKPEDPRKRKPQ